MRDGGRPVFHPSSAFSHALSAPDRNTPPGSGVLHPSRTYNWDVMNDKMVALAAITSMRTAVTAATLVGILAINRSVKCRYSRQFPAAGLTPANVYV